MRTLILLCKIIDNLGDAGVTLRLARQWLAAHPQDRIDIWTDRLDPFVRLLGPNSSRSNCIGAAAKEPSDRTPSINHFCVPDLPGLRVFSSLCPPDSYLWGNVIIEAFGTPVPDHWKMRLANREQRPVWINLEYLSAEPWVEECHGMCSTDPQTGWQQYFFFPGFTEKTGGLLGPEKPASQTQGGVPVKRPSCQAKPEGLSVFVFAYHLDALSCLLKEADLKGDAVFHLSIGNAGVCPPDILANPRTVTADFVAQSEFDEHLAQHDWLFVRGEDSFVRAQWLGKPLVWQIYPTDDGAHWSKLQSFFERYSAGLADEPRNAWWDLWLLWNGEHTRRSRAAEIWGNAVRHRQVIEGHARRWSEVLQAQTGLIERLETLISSVEGANP